MIDIDGDANPWLANDQDRLLDLARGPMAITPRGGSHRVFKQPAGKHWRCTEGRLAPKVDTRADGGYIVAHPSVVEGNKSYHWAPGLELDDPPERLPEPPSWLAQELDRLANGATTLARVPSVAAGANTIPSGQRNATLAKLAGAMRRVGMGQAEIAAALLQTNKDRCVPPLPPREVERIAASIARYEPDQVSVALVENHWEQMLAEDPAEPLSPEDPGPIPDELLRIPGFVSEVMDHCLETAPYPNVALAFCGALALQALLAGRKVRDEGDNRTNLYLLALAHSAVGKDWPRKLNTQILHRVGMSGSLGEKFASGEGIQDALFIRPAMLFQTDEIDGVLQSINKARDARHESVLGTMLTMYSAANSIYPMRRKAGKEPPGVIDQPCLVIYGTAIPPHFYEALSSRMLTNGFFARMVVVESGLRGEGQDPGIINPPPRVLDVARWWSELSPGTGNLEEWHPVPVVVETDTPARALLTEARHHAETEYTTAQAKDDAVGTTVWGRVPEQVRKLALLHAVSTNPKEPYIDVSAARWASDFVLHQTRRMLFMAAGHVAENPFHGDCLKFVRTLRQKGGEMQRQHLLRVMRCKAADFDQLVLTLVQQGEIIPVEIPTKTKTAMGYRLP